MKSLTLFLSIILKYKGKDTFCHVKRKMRTRVIQMKDAFLDRKRHKKYRTLVTRMHIAAISASLSAPPFRDTG
jgi:hypothetical protein